MAGCVRSDRDRASGARVPQSAVAGDVGARNRRRARYGPLTTCSSGARSWRFARAVREAFLSHVTSLPPATAARTCLPLPLLAAVTGFAVALLFAGPLLNDGDTYWHIAAGEWMLDHAAVPYTDPFSYSFASRPWVAHEWLSELLMALAFRAGGWNGVIALFGAALALTLGLFARHLDRWVERLPAALMLVLGGACVGPTLLARPHILALPVLELWAAGLLLARHRGAAPPLWLLPLMTLWANLHGGFIIGLGLAGWFALEAVAGAGAGWRTAARDWGVFLAGALVAALLTPHGVRGLLFPIQLMRMRHLAEINEWQPANFATFEPIEGALLALLYVALTRGIRLPPLRILLLLGLLHLALQHSRHQMIAGIVGALALAEPFGRGIAAPAARPARTWLAAAAVAVLALTAFRLVVPVGRVNDRMSPVAALDHVPPALAAQPVFNDYGFGGYLIFKGVRPFIDGRADLYGDDFLTAYGAASSGAPAPFQTLANQYGFRWSILTRDSAAAAMLDHLPGWHRMFEDGVAVVHVRDDAR